MQSPSTIFAQCRICIFLIAALLVVARPSGLLAEQPPADGAKKTKQAVIPPNTESDGEALVKAELNKPAPRFFLQTMSGQPFGLELLKGTIVVLEWVNFDCPYVKKYYESDRMQRLQLAYADQNIAWVSISSSLRNKPGFLTGEAAKQVLAEKKAKPRDFLIDDTGSIAELYGVTRTPHMVVIDREGIIRYTGGMDNLPSPEALEAGRANPNFQLAVQAVQANKKVRVAESFAYGCPLSSDKEKQ